MCLLGELGVVDRVLRRIDELAVVVEEIVAEVVRVVGVVRIVGERVVRIIVGVVDVAIEVAAAVDEIEVGDLALYGQRCLVPAVLVEVPAVTRDLAVTERGVGGEKSIGILGLPGHGRGDAPGVGEVDLQRGTGAGGLDAIEVLFPQGGIVARDAGGRVHQQWIRRDVVDEPRVAAGIANEPDRRAVRQRQVHEPFDAATRVSRVDLDDPEIVTSLEPPDLRLLGNDAQRAGHRTRAEQRALWSGQRLDPLDVVDVDVEVVVDGRDRLFVEVHTDERGGADAQAVAAIGHAADVELRLPGAEGLVRQARQVLRVIVEVADRQLSQRAGIQRLDADRHVLQALGASLRRHDDFFQAAPCLGGRRRMRREDSRDRHGQRLQGGRRHATQGGCLLQHRDPFLAMK